MKDLLTLIPPAEEERQRYPALRVQLHPNLPVLPHGHLWASAQTPAAAPTTLPPPQPPIPFGPDHPASRIAAAIQYHTNQKLIAAQHVQAAQQYFRTAQQQQQFYKDALLASLVFQALNDYCWFL